MSLKDHIVSGITMAISGIVDLFALPGFHMEDS